MLGFKLFKLGFGLGVRGQAAVTDSLYFILIITFLSIFLFGFSNSYGASIKDQVNDEFNTNFATSALKTILYSSTPRDPNDSLNDPVVEVDYLLAMLKEDFADDELINESERLVLGKTISKVLSPIQDNFDYAFYITIPSKKFVFFYLHLTNFEKKPFSVTLQELRPGEKGRFYVYSPNPSKPHVDYFCAIGHDDVQDYEALSAKLSRLFTNVGPVSQASSSIQLVKEFTKGDFRSFKAQVDLFLWNASWLGVTDERPVELFPYDSPSSDPWNCIEVVV